MPLPPTSQVTNNDKLDQILKRLEKPHELHNLEVLTEKILSDVIDIKGRVKNLEINVLIGNGEPPLKEQVHNLQRDVKDNTAMIDCHIEEDKARAEKHGMRWEKVFFEF